MVGGRNSHSDTTLELQRSNLRISTFLHSRSSGHNWKKMRALLPRRNPIVAEKVKDEKVADEGKPCGCEERKTC